MALAPGRIDDLADQIAGMNAVDRVKLMSALMERDGAVVDWSVVAGIRKKAKLKETPALHRKINAIVREVRRERRRD